MKKLIKMLLVGSMILVSTRLSKEITTKELNTKVIAHINRDTRKKLLMLGVRGNEEKPEEEMYKGFLMVSLDKDKNRESFKVNNNRIHLQMDLNSEEACNHLKKGYDMVILDTSVVKRRKGSIIDFQQYGHIKNFINDNGVVIIPALRALENTMICKEKKIVAYPFRQIPFFIHTDTEIKKTIEPKLAQIANLRLMEDASMHFAEIELIENEKYPTRSLTKDEPQPYLKMSKKRKKKQKNKVINNEEKIYQIQYDIDILLEKKYGTSSEKWYRLTSQSYEKGPAPKDKFKANKKDLNQQDIDGNHQKENKNTTDSSKKSSQIPLTQQDSNDTKAPKNHPQQASHTTRNLIIAGVVIGIPTVLILGFTASKKKKKSPKPLR